MITIAIEGMRFHAFVGWHEEEKVIGNEIQVDLYLNVSSNQSDDDVLQKTVNYETVFDAVKLVMNERINLLETVCKKIITSVTTLSPSIEEIEVRVSKMNPPLPGRVDRVFVEESWTKEM